MLLRVHTILGRNFHGVTQQWVLSAVQNPHILVYGGSRRAEINRKAHDGMYQLGERLSQAREMGSSEPGPRLFVEYHMVCSEPLAEI